MDAHGHFYQKKKSNKKAAVCNTQYKIAHVRVKNWHNAFFFLTKDLTFNF